MARTLHAEVAYSFKRLNLVLTVAAPNADTAVLQRIEQLLVDAGEGYRQRRYLDAIDAYTEARQLIWSQLYPTSRFDELKIRKLDVFQSVLSYAGEWLNALPAGTGAVGVRPREVVEIDTGQVTGLRLDALSASGVKAVADVNAAEVLERSGNAAAAKFFRNRATEQAPNLFNAGNVVLRRPLAEEGLLARVGFRNDRDRVVLKPVDVPEGVARSDRKFVTMVEGQVQTVSWTAGDAPPIEDLKAKIFERRIHLKLLPDILIRPENPADAAAALPHVFAYETTLGLAECHHALGQWAAAETWYLQAANYQYLNATVEAPYVWGRLAELYRDWGNQLFRGEDPAAALLIYEKVIAADGTEPTTDLYAIPGLKPGADVAREVLAALADPSALDVSPAIAAPVLDIWAQLSKINGGLDFWGHWAANVPIWTFDYLQSVAINFCQLAITAERDAMSFWEKADQGTLTRLQLEQNVVQAKAEAQAARAQVVAAQAQVSAYDAGEKAAQLRAEHAKQNADEYNAKSRQWSMHQALAAQLGAGDDGNAAELNRLADRMLAGPYSIRGDRGALVGAEQLAASRLQRQYEIHSMRRQQADLEASAEQAKKERQAAQARAGAAQASAYAAAVRVNGALELVDAFDEQRFTPDVWNKLGERMNGLAQRYLSMALDVAKLAQRAYNFENDTTHHLVKADYLADAIKGFLAADTLMADIQSFTYDRVTSLAPIPQPVRQTISLANQYPFLFERDFRTTGRMEFTTRIDDFDMKYPGSYAGRVLAVEIDVDGLVPPTGLSGTLTNAGISHYRVPSSDWTAGNGNGLKHRVQNRETLILSDHDRRSDAILIPGDNRRRTVFEGAGVCSSWTLDLPPSVNDLDYNGITDVRLTLTYEARFDPDLKDRVITDLAALPSIHERQRPVPIRWLFPDAFFRFLQSGIIEVELEPTWFPRSETKPALHSLGALVVTTPADRSQNITLKITPPQAAASTVTTGAGGIIDESAIGNVDGTAAAGPYTVALDAADNPSWVTGGALDLGAIDNIALILDYSFTPRS